MTVSVLIADDQAMIRSGLRLILDDQPISPWSARRPMAPRR